MSTTHQRTVKDRHMVKGGEGGRVLCRVQGWGREGAIAAAPPQPPMTGSEAANGYRGMELPLP